MPHRERWGKNAADETVLLERFEATAAQLASEDDAAKEMRLDAVDALLFRLQFNHENRIRALEGKAAITALQFRGALKAML